MLPTPKYPKALGLNPGKFATWRAKQSQCLQHLGGSEAKYIAHCAPTGSGKSVVYVADAIRAAEHKGERTVILTEAKALQDQLARDFSAVDGFVTLKGRNAYTCSGLPGRRRNCEQGKLALCPKARGSGCPATAAVVRASSAPIVSTNYAAWLQHGRLKTLGTIARVVCDEAHLAPDWVCNFLNTEWRQVDQDGLESLTGRDLPHPTRESSDTWREWARESARVLGDTLEILIERLTAARTEPNLEAVVRAQRLLHKLTIIKTVSAAKWTIEQRRGKQGKYYSFDCVWADEYAADFLYPNARRVYLTSATVLPKTLDLLGIDDRDTDYWDLPAVFTPRNGPVWLYPITGVRWNMPVEDWADLLAAMLDIIEAHNDRKGIAHAVSYKRAGEICAAILADSDLTTQVITHTNSQILPDRLELFRSAAPPCVFVSPSIGTGYDFRGDQAEYQIITKVPFTPIDNKLLTRRQAEDPDYHIYTAVLDLVQMCGRVRRSERDRGSTYILDKNAVWLLWYHRHFVPRAFQYTRVSRMPRPLGKLQEYEASG